MKASQTVLRTCSKSLRRTRKGAERPLSGQISMSALGALQPGEIRPSHALESLPRASVTSRP